MERLEKEKHISFIKDVMANSQCLILANIEGLNAEQVAKLRRELHNADVGFRVCKNKLARLAISGTPAEDLAKDFVGSTALAWSEKDAVAPAKVLAKFEAEFEKLALKAGFSGLKRLDLAGIKVLSKMPGFNELRAMLLSVFNAPASRCLAHFNTPASHLIGVLQARIDKEKQAGNG